MSLGASTCFVVEQSHPSGQLWEKHSVPFLVVQQGPATTPVFNRFVRYVCVESACKHTQITTITRIIATNVHDIVDVVLSLPQGKIYHISVYFH